MNRLSSLIHRMLSPDNAETCSFRNSCYMPNEDTSDSLGLNFQPSCMLYDENSPSYEDGLAKFIEKTQCNTFSSVAGNIAELEQSTETPEEKNDAEPSTDTKPKPSTNPAGDLMQTLKSLSEQIDESIPIESSKNRKVNLETMTPSELYLNIEKLATSDNPEIAGIGQILKNLFNELGVELWESIKSNSPSTPTYLENPNGYERIVMETVFAAIRGTELDAKDNGEETYASYVGKQYGITVKEFAALDKNGDGSIVAELKELLESKDFISICNFKIQRQKNKENNEKLIKEMDSSKDGFINENEIKMNFGNNSIADLFKLNNGSVDKSLLLVLGASKQKDGTYSITPSLLNKNLYLMDENNDGIVTKEEVENFKKSDYYNQILNFYI